MAYAHRAHFDFEPRRLELSFFFLWLWLDAGGAASGNAPAVHNEDEIALVDDDDNGDGGGQAVGGSARNDDEIALDDDDVDQAVAVSGSEVRSCQPDPGPVESNEASIDQGPPADLSKEAEDRYLAELTKPTDDTGEHLKINSWMGKWIFSCSCV